MAIANVTTTSTFDEWRTTTNQIIVQSGQAFSMSVSAWDAANNTVGNAANLTANLILANSTYMNTIVSYVVTTGNVANLVMANTMITNTIYNNANTVAASFFSNTVVVFPQANTARDHANTAFAQANTARNQANAAYTVANTGNGALAVAGWGAQHANNAFDTANNAFTQGSSASTQASTARGHANLAFGQANTARGHANAAFVNANTAYSHANAAFNKANTAGGTIQIYDDLIDATYYPVFANTTSGNASVLNVASTGLTFNPYYGSLSATEFVSLSDEAAKGNIRIIVDAVGKVEILKGVQFNFLDTGKQSAGIIAQDVMKVLPELVDEKMSVNYSGIIGLLIEAVKELNKRVTDLENK